MFPSTTRQAPAIAAPLDVAAIDRHDTEQTLAAARLIVAVVYALVLAPGASTLAWFPAFAGHRAPAVYAAYAAALCLALGRTRRTTPAARLAIHVIDLLIPLGLTLAALRPVDAPYALYLVPLVGAAVRWGAAATLASLAVAMPAALRFAGQPGDVQLASSSIAEALLVGGSVLAFVGVREQRRRVRTAAVASLRARCQAARGFRSAMRAALETLTTQFGAQEARVIARDAKSERTFVWEFVPSFPFDKALRCWRMSQTPDGMSEAGADGPSDEFSDLYL